MMLDPLALAWAFSMFNTNEIFDIHLLTLLMSLATDYAETFQVISGFNNEQDLLHCCAKEKNLTNTLNVEKWNIVHKYIYSSCEI